MRTLISTSRTPRPRRRRVVATVTLATGVLLAAGLAFAGSASAHVKVSGIDAVQGGSGVVTFRAPSESTTASTTQLLITFPTDTPFTSADVQPKAGWTGTVIMKPLPKPKTSSSGKQVTEYVAQVDFKADTAAAAIPPEDFDMFNIQVSPFPNQASVSFGALQYYSDGTTVNWDEQSANGTTPAHPAPTLQLAPAAGSNAAGQPAADSSSAQGVTASVNSAGGSSSSNWPGVVGMIAGILALLVSIAVLLLTRARGARASGESAGAGAGGTVSTGTAAGA